MIKHTEDKQYYHCEQCNYKTVIKSKVKEHLATHSDARFGCEMCGKQYKTKIHLKRHFESEHEKIRYTCESCGFEAKRKEYLKNHINTSH